MNTPGPLSCCCCFFLAMRRTPNRGGLTWNGRHKGGAGDQIHSNPDSGVVNDKGSVNAAGCLPCRGHTARAVSNNCAGQRGCFDRSDSNGYDAPIGTRVPTDRFPTPRPALKFSIDPL